MAKQRNTSSQQCAAPALKSIPRGTLSRVDIGRSFAEYDPILSKPNVFVETPATRAALDIAKSKCFFVGRRGTGKTALTFNIESRFPKKTVTLLPQMFSELGRFFELEHVRDTRQRHFKSLTCCFKRALADEVLLQWAKSGHFSFQRASGILTRERSAIENADFDLRLSTFVEETLHALDINNN